MTETHHIHPRPALDRLTQYIALALLLAVIAAAPLLTVIGLAAGMPPLLPILTGLILLLFAPFIVMLTTATPALSAAADGLRLRPRIWPGRLIPWEAIMAVKPYPLLPSADAEVGRRYLAGRARYQPARGIMLVIPSLPFYYRFTGFFAGQGWTPVIAITNRTHTDYDALVRRIEQRAGD